MAYGSLAFSLEKYFEIDWTLPNKYLTFLAVFAACLGLVLDVFGCSWRRRSTSIGGTTSRCASIVLMFLDME
jgi:hypothetical protein